MAAEVFTLKKREKFRFALEAEPERIYSLPPLSSLSFEDAQLMAKLSDESTIVKQGEKIKKFILAKCPDLEDKGLEDMEFYQIFNAYAMSEGKEKLGESKASQDS